MKRLALVLAALVVVIGYSQVAAQDNCSVTTPNLTMSANCSPDGSGTFTYSGQRTSVHP
jgi:hypothetical protein